MSTKITVEGHHTFPLDMLRYDSATPHSSKDSSTIAESFHAHLPWKDDTPFRVELNMHTRTKPTVGRWKSFGWTVVTLVLMAFSTGCSYSRPYVTAIQPAGVSGLIIERCETEWNPLQGRISTKNCNQSYVQIGTPNANANGIPVQLNNNLQGGK